MQDLQVIELKLTKNHLLKLDDLTLVIDQLIYGNIVILPTETGYLLGADALNLDAVKKVFSIKGRQFSNPIHVVVTGIKMAAELVFLNSSAERLCHHFMPGPLTVVCPKRSIVSDLLVANTGNLGIRIPDSPVMMQVAHAFGKPITATSLNLSGESEFESVEDTIDSLNWENDQIIYIVKDSHFIKNTAPSTVVTFATDPWKILREGPINKNDIAEYIKRLCRSDVQDWT